MPDRAFTAWDFHQLAPMERLEVAEWLAIHGTDIGHVLPPGIRIERGEVVYTTVLRDLLGQLEVDEETGMLPTERRRRQMVVDMPDPLRAHFGVAARPAPARRNTRSRAKKVT